MAEDTSAAKGMKLQKLEEFCKEKGFEDFGEYAEDKKVHDAIMEFTRWLVQDQPKHPGKYLLGKYF